METDAKARPSCMSQAGVRGGKEKAGRQRTRGRDRVGTTKQTTCIEQTANDTRHHGSGTRRHTLTYINFCQSKIDTKKVGPVPSRTLSD